MATPTAVFPAAIATSANLKAANNLVQTSLKVAAGTTDTILFVNSTAGFTPNCLISIDGEIIAIQSVVGLPNNQLIVAASGRGFDGTAAATHAAGASVSMLIVAWHHNSLSAEIQAIEATLGANLSNVSGSEVNSDICNYAAQQPGGSLAVGSNNITMAVPPGVIAGGTAYISGGAGTAEAVPITGVGSNNIIVTCAFAHSGAWTIKSATSGIQEALAIAAGQRRVHIPYGVKNTYAPIAIPVQSAYLKGDIQAQEQNSTVVQNMHNGHTFVANNLINKTLVITDLFIKGTSSSANGIDLTQCDTWLLERLWITNHGGHGINCFQCYSGRIRDCGIVGQQGNGIHLLQCNALMLDVNTINGNGLDGIGNHSGIWIDGQAAGTACLSIFILGGDIETNGAGGHGMGISAVFAGALKIVGVHFETNALFNVWTDNTVTDLYFCSNFSLGNQPTIGATKGIMHGNVFQGGSTPLTFSGTGQLIDLCGNLDISAPVRFYGTSGVYERSPAAMPPVYIATETGATNAIAGTSSVEQHNGQVVMWKLAHSLQAGANTANLNGAGAVAIKSSRNAANNIAAAYAVGGVIATVYDASIPAWLDLSQ